MKLTVLLSLISSITFSQVYNFGESKKRSGNYKYFNVVDGNISGFSNNIRNKYRTELKTLDLNETNLNIKELEVIESSANFFIRDEPNRLKNSICYLENKAYFLIQDHTYEEVTVFLREIADKNNIIPIYNRKITGIIYSKILKLDDKYILSVIVKNDDLDGSILFILDKEFNLIDEIETDNRFLYSNYYEIDDKMYFLNSYGGRSHKISIPRLDNSFVSYIKYEFEKDFSVLNYSICENKKGDVFVGCVGLTHNPKEPYGLKVLQLVKDDLHLIHESSISDDMYFADFDDKSKKEKLTYFSKTPTELNHVVRNQKSILKNIELSNGSNCFVFMESYQIGSAEQNENFIVFEINEKGQIERKKVIRHLMTSIVLNSEISSFYVFQGLDNEICIITNENLQMFNSEGEYIPKTKIKKSSYFGYAPFKNTVGTLISINDDMVERKIITSKKSMLAPYLIVEMEPGKLLLYQFSKKSESFGIMSY